MIKLEKLPIRFNYIMQKRQYSGLDKLIMGFDSQISALNGTNYSSKRPYPAESVSETQLNKADRAKVEGYMRVNHAGEVSAQALYLGQALVAKEESVKQAMQDSAQEEVDHLYWCRRRLEELNGRPSYLDPFWYLGSFSIGAFAGLIGDKWSLGFIEETEKQVIEHLQSHLADLPEADKKTEAILNQMQADEAQHRDKAAQYGAAELPTPIKKLMGITSKIMTKTAFWI